MIYGKKQFKFEKIYEYELPLESFKRCSNNQTEKIYKDFDNVELIKDICSIIKYPHTTILDKINYQQEHYGYIQITISKIDSSYAFVQKIEGKQKKTIYLYRLKDGANEIVRIKEKTFNQNPFTEGQIIKTIDCYDEKKWRYDSQNNNYYQIEDKERILSKWSIVENN